MHHYFPILLLTHAVLIMNSFHSRLTSQIKITNNLWLVDTRQKCISIFENAKLECSDWANFVIPLQSLSFSKRYFFIHDWWIWCKVWCVCVCARWLTAVFFNIYGRHICRTSVSNSVDIPRYRYYTVDVATNSASTMLYSCCSRITIIECTRNRDLSMTQNSITTQQSTTENRSK